MAIQVVVSSLSTIDGYGTSTDLLYWSDPMQGGVFAYFPTITMSGYASDPLTNDRMVRFANTIGSGFWVRQFDGDILPQWFGIFNNNTLISLANLDEWMQACTNFNKAVHFPEGKYLFPVDFQHDFGKFDLTISGIKGKSIITTYDGTASTNFAIPAKVDLTKPRPDDGVYHVDILGPTLDSSYSAIALTVVMGDYIQISGGTVSIITSTIKTLGYVTELNVDTGTGTGLADGLYVVAKHLNDSAAYGGGFTPQNLNGVSSFSTSGNVYYLQGTVLQRVGGIWSRFYSGALDLSGNVVSGGGFATQGNMVVKDLVFDNVRFYLFSPFDVKNAYQASTDFVSDTFMITGCRFNNCVRVLSSATYSNPTSPKNWFNNVYNSGGRPRFINFLITDNEFSYIHECICWGPPTSTNTIVTGNNVHDCYTILATFYLYMKTPPNTANFWLGRISQVISNNNFTRIRPLNPRANYTTSIIRTVGSAVINNNIFLDITQQAAYICSTNSTFNNNSVTMFIWDITAAELSSSAFYDDPPVILTKIVDNEGVIEIANNVIIAPLNTLVSVEGAASFNITGNIFIGCCQARYITAATTEISTSRVYVVRNKTKFRDKAGTGNYDTAVDVGDRTFFDKKRNLWVKQLRVLASRYCYSKNDNTASAVQYLVIQGNALIESENITNLTADDTNVFRSVSVINNNFRFCSTMHVGNNVTVQEYIFRGNYSRTSYWTMTSMTGSLTNQIQNLFFENNQLSKTLGQIILFATEDLIFKNNVFFPDEDYNSAQVYAELGISIPIFFQGVLLKGASASRIIVSGNHFVTIHSRTTALQLDNIYQAEVSNNWFDLNVPAALTNSGYGRIAVKVNNTTSINEILFTDNSIVLENSKANNLLEFDTASYAITSLVVNNNRTPVNWTSISKTVFANGKSTITYFKGTNQYHALTDDFTGTTTVTNKTPV